MPDLQLSRMISPITCMDSRTDCKVHMGFTTLESHATSFKQYMNCSSWFVRYNTIYIFYVSEYSTDISKYGNYPLVCPIANCSSINVAEAPLSSNTLIVSTCIFDPVFVLTLANTLGLRSNLGFLVGLPTRSDLRVKIQ